MITVNRFYRIIICLLVIGFICVLAGSIDSIRSQTIGISNNPNLNLLIGLTFCLISLLIIWKIFHWLDMLSEKGCLFFSIAILALMTGIFALVSFSARVSQFVDSIDVLDTAFYLRNHPEATEELPYIKYVGSFGNNYPVILFESFLIKILSGLGAHDIGDILNHLNILVLMIAVFLTWLIMKETRGIKAAAKTVTIFLMNPSLYLLVNWTYSMTYSLPIMMGILYIVLRLKRVKTKAGGMALAFVEGMLTGGGFLIRATTVFPLIAVGIIWLPSFIRKGINKRRIIQIVCFLLAAVLMITLVNIQVEKRFGKIKSRNLPLSFWTMLGSHGDGAWNDADLDKVMLIDNPENRMKFALEQTMDNYAVLGIDGTLDLWYNKIATCWTDGGFFYWSPVVSEGNALSEYLLGSGARNQLTKMYCQAFRLFMIISFLLACLITLIRKKEPEIILVLMITIFGCVAFHTIWETNVRYSIPFILPMLAVSGYGISTFQKNVDSRGLLQYAPKKTMGFVLLGFLIIVCSSLNVALKEERKLNFNRVFSTGDTRVCAEIEPHSFVKLEQDFYTDKPFNTLFFKAGLPEQKAKADCSGYMVVIRNDEGEKLKELYLPSEKIGKSGITASFDIISGHKHYYVSLEKTEPEKESLLFYTHYTYGVNPYRGVLKVDGSEAYPSDLMMDVYESETTTVFSDKGRITVILLILLSGIFIAFVPIGRKTKCPVPQ